MPIYTGYPDIDGPIDKINTGSAPGLSLMWMTVALCRTALFISDFWWQQWKGSR